MGRNKIILFSKFFLSMGVFPQDPSAIPGEIARFVSDFPKRDEMLWELSKKQDSMEGLGLSENNFSDEEKAKLANILSEIFWGNIQGRPSVFPAEAHTHEMEEIVGLVLALAGKVSVVAGKGLSAEDFSTEEKAKLLSLVNYTHPATHSAVMIDETTARRFVSDSEKSVWNGKEDVGVAYSKSETNALLDSKSATTHNHDLMYEAKSSNIQSHISSTGNVHGLTKADLGIGNVENTADLAKPISSAVQTALTFKANQADVDLAFQNLLNGSPELLNTLSELATALGNDPNFATTMTTALSGKVDKISGKGLSDENFSTLEKGKLSGIATNANNYTHPATHSPSVISQDANNRFVSDTEKSIWNAKANAGVSYTKAEDDALLALKAPQATTYTKTEVDTELSGKSSTSHTHTTSAISEGTNLYYTNARGISSLLTGFATSATRTAIVATDTVLQGFSKCQKYFNDLSTLAFSGSWNDISGKPSSFAPSAHSHIILDTTGLQTALDGKVDKITGKGLSTEDFLSAEKTKLSGIATGANLYIHPVTHSIAEISGLQSALDGKVSTSSTETIGGVKTFSVSPIVPTPTTAYQISTKKYVDDSMASAGNGDMLKSVYDSTNNGKVDIAETAEKLSVARNINGVLFDGTTNITVADSTKEPVISVKNSAFNKNFGTGADTVCGGNDARLSDPRTPTAHTHAISATTGLQIALDGKSSTTHNHSGVYEPANANVQGHISSTSNPHSTTKAQVGLSNVDNTSDLAKPISTATQTALDEKANQATTYTKTEIDSTFLSLLNGSPELLNTLDELANALGDDPNFATTMTNALAGKVEKITGKGLSTEDYLTAEKTKLAGIATGANNYVHPATHSIAEISGLQSALDGKQASASVLNNTTASFTTAQETKLAGIATGATANDTDANLKNRENHTGTQALSTISQSGATTGQYAKWNGTAWVPSDVASGNLFTSAMTTGEAIDGTIPKVVKYTAGSVFPLNPVLAGTNKLCGTTYGSPNSWAESFTVPVGATSISSIKVPMRLHMNTGSDNVFVMISRNTPSAITYSNSSTYIQRFTVNLSTLPTSFTSIEILAAAISVAGGETLTIAIQSQGSTSQVNAIFLPISTSFPLGVTAQYYNAGASIASTLTNNSFITFGLTCNAVAGLVKATTSTTDGSQLGFVASNVSSGASTTVQVAGIVSGFTGITVGQPYYLSATAGGIATTGTALQKVAKGYSSTSLLITL